MVSSTTLIPPTRADWTAYGAHTSGSTAPPRGATRQATGGTSTTSTTNAERSRGCRYPRIGHKIAPFMLHSLMLGRSLECYGEHEGRPPVSTTRRRVIAVDALQIQR